MINLTSRVFGLAQIVHTPRNFMLLPHASVRVFDVGETIFIFSLKHVQREPQRGDWQITRGATFVFVVDSKNPSTKKIKFASVFDRGVFASKTTSHPKSHVPYGTST